VRIIVVQAGARHRYAVPRMFEQAGVLEALYTDSHAGSPLGRACGFLPGAWAGTARLKRRLIEGVPRERIRATDLPALADPVLRRVSASWYDYYRRRDRIFSSVLKRWGVGEATAVYSMFGEGLEYLRWAKERGLRIVLDVFINPITHRILEEERRKLAGWEEPDRVDFQALERDIDTRIALADVLICPSEAVVEGIRCYSSLCMSKARLVPYGFACDLPGGNGETCKGMVMFGGEANLRKGIQYLAKAAEMLASKEGTFQFRVAGSVADRIRSRPEVRRLEFLGPLPRDRFLRELRSADVFALPTLAEGSASVVYEALACGVPVVTTASAGSVVTDGAEGRIVPERDAAALAVAIEEIVLDRSLRERMSAAALRAAASHTEEQWRERLVAALASVLETPKASGSKPK